MQNETFKKNDEIDLMGLFLVLRRRKWIIIGIVFLSMLSAFLFITVLQQKELRTEMVLALNFEGIDKGLYPDGSNFESKDIVAPNVLKKLDVDIDLSGNIFVEEVIPEYIKEKIKEDPEFVYYPSRFKIVLVERDEAAFESEKERVDVLNTIADIFKTVFNKKFIQEPEISFQFPDNFVQSYEYDDIIYIFQTDIRLIEEFLDKKIIEIGGFRSSEYGYSFSEILSELFALKELDLKNITSKINMFNLARNKNFLIAKIEHDINNLEYSRLKNEKLSEISFELLKIVRLSNELKQGEKIIGSDQSSAQVVVDSSVLDKFKENDYVFYLIKSSLRAETLKINDSLRISKLKNRREGLKNSDTNLTISDKEMTETFGSLWNKIFEITQKVNLLNKEYLELKFVRAVSINNSPEHLINYQYKPALTLALTFVASLFLVYS